MSEFVFLLMILTHFPRADVISQSKFRIGNFRFSALCAGIASTSANGVNPAADSELDSVVIVIKLGGPL